MIEYEKWRLGNCVFQCKLCDKDFGVSPAFWHHITEDHNIAKSKYIELHGRGLVNSEYMRCEICHEDILFEFGSLRSHMKKIHSGLNLKDYYEEFVCDDDILDSDDDSNSVVFMWSSFSNHEEDIVSGSSSPKQKTRFSLSEDISEEVRNWADQCSYTCPTCKWTTQHFQEFAAHVETSHQLDLVNFEKIFGDYRQLIKLHECKMCHQHKRHDLYVLAKHMTNSHKYPIEKYFDTFVKKDLKDNTEETALKTSSIIEKTASVQMKNINQESIQTSLSSNKGRSQTHSPKKLLKSSRKYYWLNKCTFFCHLCSREICVLTKGGFQKHLKTAHKSTLESYKRKHGDDFYCQKIYHKCKICLKEILNEHSQVRDHLGKSHSLSVRAYDEFLENGKHSEDTSTKRKSSKEHNSNSKPKTNPSLRSSNFSKGMLPKVETSWWNRCRFSCKLCGSELSTSSSFRLHLKGKHGISRAEYCQNHGDPMVEKSFETCAVCQSEVLSEYDELRRHFSMHKLSIKMYHAKYKMKKNHHNEKQEPHQTENNPPGAAVKNCKEVDHGHFYFKCNICSETFPFKSKFSQHLRKNHSITIGAYELIYGTAKNRRDSQECRIRSMPIQSDEESARRHLHEKHRLSASNYQDYDRHLDKHNDHISLEMRHPQNEVVDLQGSANFLKDQEQEEREKESSEIIDKDPLALSSSH